MNLIREAVEDTAGAAQVIETLDLDLNSLGRDRTLYDEIFFILCFQYIAAHKLWDTGAVASARAAEIYGLNILADGIQVRLS